MNLSMTEMLDSNQEIHVYKIFITRMVNVPHKGITRIQECITLKHPIPMYKILLHKLIITYRN